MYTILVVLATLSVTSAQRQQQFQPQQQQQQQQQQSCTDPRERGDFCSTNPQRQMFYYNPQQKLCQPFMYNGCNGNGNRFSTAKECQDYCINGPGAQGNPAAARDSAEHRQMAQACNAEYDVDHLTVTRCGNGGQQCPNGYACTSGFCCPQASFLCNMNYDAGKFSTTSVKSDRYFFTREFNTCMRFSYYGTQGNENNFPNYNACMRMCGSQRV